MTEQDFATVLADNLRLRAEVDQLRKERDEARRWICHAGDLSLKFAKQLALLRGWDCFKEDNHNA